MKKKQVAKRQAFPITTWKRFLKRFFERNLQSKQLEPFAIDRSRFGEDGKRIRPCPKKGTYNRRILKEIEIKGYKYAYHATKGWRRVHD